MRFCRNLNLRLSPRGMTTDRKGWSGKGWGRKDTARNNRVVKKAMQQTRGNHRGVSAGTWDGGVHQRCRRRVSICTYVPYAFDGKKWNAGGDAPVEDDAEVAAYLPYNGQTAGDRLIPLWTGGPARHPVWKGIGHRDIPTADIEMSMPWAWYASKFWKMNIWEKALFQT